jgi:hypothetical protein
MGRIPLVMASIACFAFATPAAAVDEHEVIFQADLRGVAIDSPLPSFTEGGLGLLRFDDANDGAQIGRVSLDFTGPVGETFRYTLTTSGTDDGDRHALDITEAYLDWRPYPTNAWRWRARVGAFYAPISLENRAAGWESIYSLSPSAINTWLGEEARTIGAEIATTWLGAHSGHDFDITLLGAAYRWNDPFGVLLFQRGWGIHDRQSPLFGELPRMFVRNPDNRTLEFFHEIDDRTGYYAGAEIKWTNDWLVRATHYDNLGDVKDASAKEPAWRTRFDALGTRFELPYDITLLTQAMFGDTEGVPRNGRGMFLVEFWAYYALVSQRFGPHRYTARFDRMYTDTERGAEFFTSAQNARAWTLAYQFDLNEHWQFAVEAVRIEGSLSQRAELGIAPYAIERQLQLAVRWTQ